MQLVQLQSIKFKNNNSEVDNSQAEMTPKRKSSVFSVTVRNVEPLLRITGSATKRRGETIITDIAYALMLWSALILFLMMAGLSNLIICTIPAIVVVVVIAMLEHRLSPKARYLLLVLLAILSVVASIVLRKYFVNGCNLIMNQLYDYGEAAQAYIYTRAKIGATGESSPRVCMMIATLVISVMAGIIVSIPPRAKRVGASIAIFAASMLLIAYYGLMPSRIGIILILIATILLLGKGRIISSLPIILIISIVFAGFIALNPGENRTISRIDENLRDRIAFGSSFVQSSDTLDSQSDLKFEGDEVEEKEEAGFFKSELFREHKLLWISLFALIPVGIIAAMFYLALRRLRAARMSMREGIDSEDDKLAIKALFPYAMRWLKASGITSFEESGLPFSAMATQIGEETTHEYELKFRQMNEVWKQAAYSERQAIPEDRVAMQDFLDETIRISKEKMNWKARLHARYITAL